MICNRTDYVRNDAGNAVKSTRYVVESVVCVIREEVEKGRIIMEIHETEDMFIFNSFEPMFDGGESGSTYLIEKKAWE